jgi:hypothetical protein
VPTAVNLDILQGVFHLIIYYETYYRVPICQVRKVIVLII